MRICLFTPTFLPRLGGAERSADMIVRGLQQRGHDVRVLARGIGKNKTEPQLPYPVHRYPRSRHLHKFPPAFAWPLLKLHRAWPFELCLAFYSYPTGYAASLIKNRRRFKLLCSPRGNDLYDDSQMLEQPALRRYIERGYRQADRIIHISHWMDRLLHQRIGPPLPPADVVYNGIDIANTDALRQQAAANPPELPIDQPYVLHLARLARIKNQQLAVQAVARLQNRFREIGLQYALVGDGSPDREQLQSQIDHLGIGDIVKMLGPRTGIEKAWLLDNARFFVTTSREEAFGHVVIEAMAHGLPILASNTGSHPELIENHGWGTLFESDDLDDLTRKLEHMLTADSAPMRHAALARREQFDLSHMIDGYEQACLKTLDSPAR